MISAIFFSALVHYSRWAHAAERNDVESPTERVMRFSVHFADDVPSEDEVRLDWLAEIATALKARYRARIELSGYLEAGEIGSRALMLAHNRIGAVAQRLLEFGVPARKIVQRVEYDALGTAPCMTEVCRASYRRVGVRVYLPAADPPKKSRKTR